MNSTQLLLLGLLVWFAMSNKSKDTRNVLLVVAGILFFCMMNGKEGFALAAGVEGTVTGDVTNDVFTIVNAEEVTALDADSSDTDAVNNAISCVKEDRTNTRATTVAWVDGVTTDTVNGLNGVNDSNIDQVLVCNATACAEDYMVTEGENGGDVCTEKPACGTSEQENCRTPPCTEVDTPYAGCIPQDCTPPADPSEPYNSTEPYEGCLCPAGTVPMGEKCTDCEAGTYRSATDDQVKCLPCQAGQTSEAGADTCKSVCEVAGESCKSSSGLDWWIALIFSPCEGGDSCQT